MDDRSLRPVAFGEPAALLVRNDRELVPTELYGPMTAGERTAAGLLLGLDLVVKPAAAVVFAPLYLFAACGGSDC